MRRCVWMAMMLGALFLGCADDEATPEDPDGEAGGPSGKQATATLAAKSGNTSLAGTATFAQSGSTVTATIEVTGAPPGEHGVHIHMTGDCSSADAMSAGGHWDPTMHMHGAPGPNTHLGDLGNMTVASDGKGTLKLSNADWQIGTGSSTDVVGKAVVVHAMPDDLTSQPAGNSGARIGCGVIMAK